MKRASVLAPSSLLALASLFACGSPADEPARSEERESLGSGPASASVSLDGQGDLGTVRLASGCVELADSHASRGLALLHHMTYPEAREAFAAAVEADPGCTLGYWGQAMTLIHPLWSDAPTDDEIVRGRELVETATRQTRPEGRAAGYLSTVAAYFTDGESRTEPQRLLEFEGAWRAVHEAHPDDVEARAFYALSRLATASPEDKTYEHQHEALALLADVLEAIPDHPGAHHYVIHARDYPPLAKDGLDIADAYGRLAPDNAHALHMPTHLYTRVGRWNASISGNERSAASAWAAGERMGGINTHFHHALDYLAYAHLQRAEDDLAMAVMERALSADGPWAAVNLNASAYALAAVPARFALERRDWAGAATLEPRQPPGFPWSDRFAPFEALTQFARAIGGARGGRPDIAREAIAELRELRSRISEMASNEYWMKQVEVQILAGEGWLAFESGDPVLGIEMMTEAAELEASTEKAPVTPGELLPAAELLGEMLLASGRPAEALDWFAAALERSPERLNGLAGAARAAREAGQNDLAEGYYRQLLELTADAEVTRPAMVEAGEFLESLQ